MHLVVGLGNPGSAYVGTRHNIGWEVVDELALRLGWTPRRDDFDRVAKHKFDGLVMDGLVGDGGKLLLLKPVTYMNLSGQAVAAAMAFYQLDPKDMLVVLDDLALPAGKLRIRKGGSSGGHNGLKDIERALGTDQYPRLRIGIDPAPPRIPGRDYVLGKFTPQQRPAIDAAVEKSAAAIRCWIDRGVDTAMNLFNAEQ